MTIGEVAVFSGRPDRLSDCVHRRVHERFSPQRYSREKCEKFLILLGERAGTRTRDLLIKSQLLYRLSYALVTMRKILPVDAVSIPKKAPGQAFHRARGSV
jgi:hypothetical protein